MEEVQKKADRNERGESLRAGRDSREAMARGDEGEGEKLPTEATENRIMIPGLPNDIALDIFVRVPRVLQACCRAVCCSWKHAMEPAAMHSLRKTLHIPEVWLVAECLAPFTIFSVVDVLRDRCYSFSWSQLARVCGFNIPWCTYFCTVGHEVLVTAQVNPEHKNFLAVKEMEGLYSFDAVRMEWSSGKYASLPAGDDVWAARAVDMERGYLYASRKQGERTNGGFKHTMLRLDLKTKRWEELPGHLLLHRKHFRGVMLQNRLCIFAGGEKVHTNQEWTLVPDIWSGTGIKGQEFWQGVAVVMGKLYALRNITAAPQDIMQLICYETSSKEWIFLDNVPASDDRIPASNDRIIRRPFETTLLGVGEELWVSCQGCQTIWTTKPLGFQPLSWRSHSVGSFDSLKRCPFVAVMLV